jgi:hypothetical protein
VDLRGCEVLSEVFFLWSGAAPRARLGALLASKMLRGQVRVATPAEYPAALRSPLFHGKVYRLADLVLDVPSLVATLAERQRDAIFTIDWDRAFLRREGERAVLALDGCTLLPERLLLTAGAGNEALIAKLAGTAPAMQRRPLQQVLVRHHNTEPFYGHCLGGGATPRLTISSHRDSRGRPVWYLGGDLSSGAAHELPEALIARARSELARLLPWLDLGESEWATLRLDRAEPRQAGLLRPDSAFVGKLDSVTNALAAWPTKLTLCPDLASKVEAELAREHILPRHDHDLAALASLPRPALATPLWDSVFP